MKRPNIILILADDMGFSDLGCYGSEICTPHLDSLAKAGARYTQFYNGARCMPSRASLLTGLYPHQAGIGQMAGPDDYGPAYQGYLNHHCITHGEALLSGGYRTGMVGKWHVGHGFQGDANRLPRQRGFERFWGIATGAANYFEPSKNTRHNTPNELMDDDAEIQAEGYFTDMISDNAVSYIDEHAGKEPFFLYAAYTAPHWPLHALPEDIAKYKGVYDKGWDHIRRERYEKQKTLGIVGASCGLTERDENATAWEETTEKEWQARRMEVYAAQIDRLDQGIGRIIDKLKEKGEFDNTLIVFLSDNGACAEPMPDNNPSVWPGAKETWASYGLPWANASNTPFRLYKHWVHEGGIASPMIAHWPNRIAPGTGVDEPSHLIDMMPTFLDAADVSYPETYNGNAIPVMEGRSMLPLWGGEQLPERILAWEHEGNRAVRQGRWKLVSRFGGGSPHAIRDVDPPVVDEEWHLYDMEEDRSEMRNLASERPEIVQRLSDAYSEWSDRIGVKPWRVANQPGPNYARERERSRNGEKA